MDIDEPGFFPKMLSYCMCFDTGKEFFSDF